MSDDRSHTTVVFVTISALQKKLGDLPWADDKGDIWLWVQVEAFDPATAQSYRCRRWFHERFPSVATAMLAWRVLQQTPVHQKARIACVQISTLDENGRYQDTTVQHLDTEGDNIV